MSRNIRCLVGRQEPDGRGDVLRGAEALQRNLLRPLLVSPFRHPLGHVGVHQPGGHCVDRNLARRNLKGQCLGEPNQARLGRRIVDLTRTACTQV